MPSLAGLGLFGGKNQSGSNVQDQQETCNLQEIKLIFPTEAIEPSEFLANQTPTYQ